MNYTALNFEAMHTINWGIIGCGDVTEKKSGPAFNKVPGSKLVAVMRRDATKAADYARRHGVPRWYHDAAALINDDEVNAIYIATPPGSHELYTMQALQAGKPVYVEKPMTVDYAAALRMQAAAELAGQKLTVAHYRRGWPMFNEIKRMLQQNAIGEPQYIMLEFAAPPLTAEDLAKPGIAWRVNPKDSGGGLFHDLAPHQLDLMYYFFGEAAHVTGIAQQRNLLYKAHDLVSGQVQFASGVQFSGTWCFNAFAATDKCTITGTKGKLEFAIFGKQEVSYTTDEGIKILEFAPHEHVQQPMIEQVVRYFRGEGPNPCSAKEGAEIMRWMDLMTIDGINSK